MHTQASMLQVLFEPTIPVFEQAKTVHALDRRATVSGRNSTAVQKLRKNFLRDDELMKLKPIVNVTQKVTT
jgi:hypothetical protein